MMASSFGLRPPRPQTVLNVGLMKLALRLRDEGPLRGTTLFDRWT